MISQISNRIKNLLNEYKQLKNSHSILLVNKLYCNTFEVVLPVIDGVSNMFTIVFDKTPVVYSLNYSTNDFIGRNNKLQVDTNPTDTLLHIINKIQDKINTAQNNVVLTERELTHNNTTYSVILTNHLNNQSKETPEDINALIEDKKIKEVSLLWLKRKYYITDNKPVEKPPIVVLKNKLNTMLSYLNSQA
jgi:hypothetical protein